MHVPEVVHKYWPYMVGGTVGLYVLFKLRGNSAAPVDNTAAMLASQASAGAANSQAQAQLAAVQAQAAATNHASDNAFAVQMAQLTAGIGAQNNAAQVANMNAQAAMAGAIGSSAAQVVASLNLPAMQAINSAATENSAVLGAAASVANTGFLAQASSIKATAGVTQSIASSLLNTQISTGQFTQAAAGTGAAVQQGSSGGGSSTNDTIKTVGEVASVAAMFFSDSNVKEEIAITKRDSVSDICELDFIEFKYINELVGEQDVNSPSLGIIAQKAESINPDWVLNDMPYKRLNTNAMLMSALHAVSLLAAEVAILKGQ